MKRTFIALFLLTASLIGGDAKEKFPEFMEIDKKSAAVTARRQAESDFAAGKYRLVVYGLRKGISSEERRLAEAGVEVKPIAGCIVSDGILEGARIYNEVMREKLKAKLGRDVFDDVKNTSNNTRK